MSYELVGKLIEKFDVVQVSDKFKKREFVVEKEEMVGTSTFTDQIKFQLTQDRCGIVDEYNVGNEVKVSFNIRGRKWEKDGRVNYFTNLEAWRIESAVAENATPMNEAPPITMDDSPADSEEDDLPF